MKIRDVKCPVCGPVEVATLLEKVFERDTTFEAGQLGAYSDAPKKVVFRCQCDLCGEEFEFEKEPNK